MNRIELIKILADVAEIPVSEGEMFLEMFLKRASVEIIAGQNYYLPQLGVFRFETNSDGETFFTFLNDGENISFSLPQEEKVFSYSRFSLSIGKPLFPLQGKSEKFNFLLRPNENISSLEAKAERVTYLIEEAEQQGDDIDNLSIFADTLDVPENDLIALNEENIQINGNDAIFSEIIKDNLPAESDTMLTKTEDDLTIAEDIVKADEEEDEIDYEEELTVSNQEGITESNTLQQIDEIFKDEVLEGNTAENEIASSLLEPNASSIDDQEINKNEIKNFINESEDFGFTDDEDLANFKDPEEVSGEVTEVITETSFEELAEKIEIPEEPEVFDEEDSFIALASTIEIDDNLPAQGEDFKSLVRDAGEYDDFQKNKIPDEKSEDVPDTKNSDTDISQNYQRVKSLTREFFSLTDQEQKENMLTWDFGESEEIDKDIKAVTRAFDEPEKSSADQNKDGYTFIPSKRATMEWMPGTLPDLESIISEQNDEPEEIKLSIDEDSTNEEIVTDTVRIRKREQKNWKPLIITASIVVFLVLVVLAYYKLTSPGTSELGNSIKPTIIERKDPVPVMIIGEVEKPDTEKDESVPAFSEDVNTTVDDESRAVKISDMLFMKNDKYYVQVSSWKVRSNAVKDSDRFLLLGYKTEIQTSVNNSATWYRVLVGDFETTAEVEEFENKNL